MSVLDEDQTQRIAIIGLAARLPGAADVDQFWSNLRSGVESVTTFNDDQLLSAGVDPALLNLSNYVKAGVLLDGIETFDASFFGYTPREAELLDPQHRIFLECAWEALESSGYQPDAVPARVGVFAGAGFNNYLVYNLSSYSDRLQSMNYLQRMMALDKDYLATRVSYKLNLTGPSFTVQTACSTSLVAVHLACQSLLNGECDMAIAGGVSIRIPQMAGYLFEQGSTLSSDGHCRAFDADAQGMITGSGVGIVVLKRFADALRDRDNVRAVIRSSCINNDGSAKAGFTAPSADGQATVIAEAQAIAGITADQVGYVETHGTGTPIGDPIEIAALTKAFRKTTDKKGYCPVGSLKTNIGHLDAAAGVASLIKVVMSLEHRELPPSLHFRKPNPVIDFASTPFFVQSELSPWKSNDGSRLAGVSSFGIGGTNAHIVVEEAPTQTSHEAMRRSQLLTISAKNRETLEQSAQRLADHLDTHRSLNLADVAFTLQTGRKAFPCRRAVVVNSIDEAVQALRLPPSNRVYTAQAFATEPTVTFMFPAQGAQHVNMGRDLYASEQVFRNYVDACAEHLSPTLGLDLRSVLFPDDANAEWASEQLRQTRLTQPAVFTINYALAQQWMSWGVLPSAMVGHSLGEYVAATISGVFTLEDALGIVAERARLMQELPAGSMLAVHLSEQDLQPWLCDGISVAGINAPSLSVISGCTAVVNRVAQDLEARKVEAQVLKTSHAFHSAMMDEMIGPLIEKVRRVPRNAPRIPFVSTLTGTWISTEQAVDPTYWGRQTRYGVRFSDAVAELLKTPGRVLLEVGPGNTLTTLARLNFTSEKAAIAVNSLRHAKEERNDVESVLTALGRLWNAGLIVNWTLLYPGEQRRRVPVSTYPFERKRFWIEPRPAHSLSEKRGGLSSPESEANNEAVSLSADEVPSHPETSLYARPELTTAYRIPSNQTERKLTKIWEQVLGVKVGADDNFFELGGHSLMAVTLMGKIEQEFGRRLPLASLIQAPTVREFAAMVANAQTETVSWRSLVKLSDGRQQRPLFLMHSHGGNVLEYKPLADRLGKDLTLYALQARGLDGNIPEGLCIEEMASHYLREIRSLQPHGPYYLGGFCFGGFLALEAAQQLRHVGEAVAIVVMINSATQDYPVYPVRTNSFSKAFYKLQYRCALELTNASGKGVRNLGRYSIGRVKRIKELAQARVETVLECLPGGLQLAKHSITYQLEHLAAAHDHAWAIYQPKPYDGKVKLLYAEHQPLGICVDPSLGWRRLLIADFEAIEVPGFRQNMLDEPYVDAVANVLLDLVNNCYVNELNDRVPA
jgi:acyl transferase domain-containing protein